MQYRATFAHTCTSRIAYHGVVWALLANFAHAQDSAVDQVPTAAATTTSNTAPSADFQRGLEALKAGQNLQAIEAFKIAYDREHNPAALLNIGIAYTNLERPHAAVQALESYISKADYVRDAESIASVRAEIERLRNGSGRIGVHLIPEHAQVELDGEPVSLPSGELLAAPGKRHISARAEGFKPFEQTLDVQAGQFTLEIQLHKIDASPAAAAAVAAPVTAEAVATKPAAPMAPQLEPTDEPEASAASSCALDQVCVGPVVSLLGPPNLIGGGLHARIGRYLGLGVDYQVLPTLNFNPISVGTSLVSANARVYPFGGAFFLGGGIGYQTIRGQLRQEELGVSAKAGFPAAMASIGFMGHDGFVLGADLGLLFPLSPIQAKVEQNTGTLAQSGIPQSDIDAAREKAETEVNKVLGALPLLVQVNLIRVGYMF